MARIRLERILAYTCEKLGYNRQTEKWRQFVKGTVKKIRRLSK